jgi:hypothetical protein
VNRGDVRVIKRSQRPCFAFEASEPVGVGGKCFGQHFDGYVAAEVDVSGFVTFAHPARADRRDNLVGAETCAGTNGITSSP